MRLLAAVLLVGCGSGSNNSPDLSVDAGASMLTALISVAPDLIGFPTKLDGSGSVDPAGGTLSYAWHFAKQPAGSTVTDGDLSPVPMPSYSPDKGGAWTVALTVTSSAGQSASTQLDFDVPTVPIFYRSGTFGANSENIEIGVVRSDGSGAHAISCAVTGSYDGGPPLGADFEFPTLFGMRVWDPPTPGISRLVFEEARGGNEWRLYATDENGDCNAHPPVRLDDSTTGSHQFPRFNPSGTRVAWIDGSTPPRVITVGIDGSNRHVVRSSMARNPGTPPVWFGDNALSWVEDLNASGVPHLVIKFSDDATAAGDALSQSLLDCDPNDATALHVINQFELIENTVFIIAGGTQSRLQTNTPVEVDLYRFDYRNCATGTATLLASEPPGGDSWDFAVSPDEKTLVLSSSHGQIIGDAGTPPHDLFVIGAHGISPTLTRFAGSDANLDDVGPRWLAGGRQLGWTQLGQGGGLAVANANGQSVRNVLPQGAATVAGPTNRGSDCAFGGHDVALSPLFAALVLFWRRRR